MALKSPQVLPYRAQSASALSGTHVGAWQTPAALQLCPAGHAPQEATVREEPQLSRPENGPQLRPARWQSAASGSGAQPGLPQRPGVPPPPHVCGNAHVPQLATARDALQLSSAVSGPHVACKRAQRLASDSGVQVLGAPQTFGAPAPPQVCGAAQAPQLSVPPQPSAAAPQLKPSA